jgi:hypothetical protein
MRVFRKTINKYGNEICHFVIVRIIQFKVNGVEWKRIIQRAIFKNKKKRRKVLFNFRFTNENYVILYLERERERKK